MDLLPKSHYGRFIHPGPPPWVGMAIPAFYARFVNNDGMDSLPKSRYGRFIHPGPPPWSIH